MRRHWSVLAPKSQFTQHNSHWTCNLALHNALWEIQSSFFFFRLVGKSLCIKTGALTTLSLYCILQIIFHSFWKLWIRGTCLSTTQSNVLYLWHHDSFLLHHGKNKNNSTSQTSVSSRPLFSFGFFSCTFLHPCSSINPTLHHLFQWIYIHSKTLQGCIQVARSDLANSSF